MDLTAPTSRTFLTVHRNAKKKKKLQTSIQQVVRMKPSSVTWIHQQVGAGLVLLLFSIRERERVRATSCWPCQIYSDMLFIILI